MLIVFLLKYQLMGMFTDDPEVIRIGSEYLVIVSSFYLLFTVMFKINGVLRGAGKSPVLGGEAERPGIQGGTVAATDLDGRLAFSPSQHWRLNYQ